MRPTLPGSPGSNFPPRRRRRALPWPAACAGSKPPGTPVRDASRAMREHHIGAVLVIDPQGRLLGIVSRGDFRAAELDRLEAESALRERM
jgi:hypothetical protein